MLWNKVKIECENLSCYVISSNVTTNCAPDEMERWRDGWIVECCQLVVKLSGTCRSLLSRSTNQK